MSSELNIRDARPADLAAVHELLVDTWHDTYDELIGADEVADITGRWHNIDVLRRQQADPDLIFLVAESAGRIVGHALACPQTSGQGTLNRLYISPDCQGMGTGAALLARVRQRLGRAASITLEVEENNKKAVEFYQRHGFTETGRKAHCGDDSNVPAITMHRAGDT